MNSNLAAPGPGAWAVLLGFLGLSIWLGIRARREVQSGSFVKGYFLGNRTLGSWAMALTATVHSGGTFMGYPSLVYSHGWVVLLVVSGYMVVPITTYAVLGKRVGQLSRRTGAVTVPDLFRERFESPAVGVVASFFILFFVAFALVAQFKAGAILMKTTCLGSGAASSVDSAYIGGLAIFALAVVGYTLIGGFLAAVWTDLFQSVLMLAGVLVLMGLALSAAGGTEAATRDALARGCTGFATGPGYAEDGRQFLPLGLAVSFFFMNVFAVMGSPATMSRFMASKDTATVRRSMFLLAIYNALIYIPLAIISICGRSLLPDLGAARSDEIVPRLAIALTARFPGGSLVGGLILAAPFGAVMATVSWYLIMIASGLVRDLYQRCLNPKASPERIRRLSRVAIFAVAAGAIAASLRPAAYLQALIIFSGTSAGATFIVPAVMTFYWRRATATGALAAMLSGAGTMLLLFALGWAGEDPGIGAATRFRPYYLLGLDPFLWALAASLVGGVGGSLLSRPPRPEHVERLLGRDQDDQTLQPDKVGAEVIG